MKKADVVIGAMWGDEGKGLFTDYLSTLDSTVVRFSGGAQAGHTVVTPEGKRHVFHHFGSGTFQGAVTYLSEYFIVNPSLFRKEFKILQQMGITPIVYMDISALVTTPFDMALNQALEVSRKDPHGSCGVGIWETVNRNKELKYSTTVFEIINQGKLVNTLSKIHYTYIPKQFHYADNPVVAMKYYYSLIPDNITCNVRFIDDIMFMLDNVHLVNGPKKVPKNHIIFEGAQGLMLSDDREEFYPHVTATNTGIKNACQLAKQFDIEELNVYYMTRAYCTRHGEGYMRGNGSRFPVYKGIIDETNIFNPWQGYIRYGYFECDFLKENVNIDLRCTPTDIKLNPSIVITCMDQVDEKVVFMKDDSYWISRDKQSFIEQVDLILPVSHVSYGPTRNDIQKR